MSTQSLTGRILVCLPIPAKKNLFYIGPHWPLMLFGILLLVGTTIPIDLFLFTQLQTSCLVIHSLTILLYLILGLFSNPGLAFQNPPEYFTGLRCRSCDIQIEARTRHCAECEVCIRGYDHHCPWVGKCIGGDNVSLFYVFIGLLLCSFSISIIATIMSKSMQE